ncbi:MAG: M48 family metalloprotease [Thermodesulfobacteriota bacterium]
MTDNLPYESAIISDFGLRSKNLFNAIFFPGKRLGMKISFTKITAAILALLLLTFSPLSPMPGIRRAFALSIEEEKKLGEEVVREVEGKFTLVRDPALLEYMNALGQDILKTAAPQPFPFRFYLLKDPQLNAFSVPGGHVFLTTGIIELMESEGELAGLIGHEIAHVTRRHISNRMDQQKKIGLATMAAVLLGVFAGDPRIASATIAGSLATAQTLFLKYSRDDEDEADNYGFKYMAGAGFNPKGMNELLDKLRRWGSFGSETIPAYMQTHPLTADRMARVEDLLQIYTGRGSWPRSTSDEFRRLQIILLSQYGDLQRARNRFQSLAKDDQNQFWVLYGQGWIAIREGKMDTANDLFEKALVLRPKDPYVLTDLGRAYLKQGRFDLALQKLGEASILHPKDGNAAFFLGRVYQEKGQDQLALENFNRSLRSGLENEDLYYYTGLIYGKLNQLGQAHYHFGKSFQIKGDREKALFHYKTALKYSGNDFREKERIEKEIKNLERGKKDKEKPPDRF